MEHPVGFIAKIYAVDESFIEPISIIGATAVCGRYRILCGATRFVNSSCRPNCSYVVGCYQGLNVIQLLTLEHISEGAELTVYYGENFLRDNVCPHADLHVKQTEILKSDANSYTPASSFTFKRKSVANFDFRSKRKKNGSYKTKAALEIDLRPISESEEDFDVSINGTREERVCNVSFVDQSDRDCVTHNALGGKINIRI